MELRESGHKPQQVKGGETAYERLYRMAITEKNANASVTRTNVARTVANDVGQSNLQIPHQGDGIMTDVDIDVEELDYIDDLQTDDDEMFQVVAPNSVAEGEPGTSRDKGTTADPSERASMVDPEGILGNNKSAKNLDDERIMALMGRVFDVKFKEMFKSQEPRCMGPPLKTQEKIDQMGKRQSMQKTETTPKAVNQNAIKSPSDTTIYAPALNKQMTNLTVSKAVNRLSEGQESMIRSANIDVNGVLLQHLFNTHDQSSFVCNTDVSNFVEAIHQEQEQGGAARDAGNKMASDIRKQQERRISSELVIPDRTKAQAKVDKSVIKAEKFRATVA